MREKENFEEDMNQLLDNHISSQMQERVIEWLKEQLLKSISFILCEQLIVLLVIPFSFS